MYFLEFPFYLGFSIIVFVMLMCFLIGRRDRQLLYNVPPPYRARPAILPPYEQLPENIEECPLRGLG